MVKAGDPMTVIDIRQPDVYEAGHIEGAVNLPWGSDALVDQLASIPQEGNVFVYCYTGQTAGQTVALMNLVGIPARSVNLGWNLGISKVEGVDAVTETTANSLPSATYDLDPNLYGAYKAYFADMATKVGTNFANNIVSEANAKAILDAADPDVAFVSIRRAEHYAEGHIPTATNMPWGKGMQTMFDSLPADKKLIVYCYSGQTAGQTVAMLRVLGYDAVSLRGGMGVGANAPQGWANQGYEVVASN
jgi:rhodanese-related sulfurtransferase